MGNGFKIEIDQVRLQFGRVQNEMPLPRRGAVARVSGVQGLSVFGFEGVGFSKAFKLRGSESKASNGFSVWGSLELACVIGHVPADAGWKLREYCKLILLDHL